MVVGIVVVALIMAAAVALGLYVDNNRHSEERSIARVYAAGFVEKQFEVPRAALSSPASMEQVAQSSETAVQEYSTPQPNLASQSGNAVINYAEGPNNGPALVLVHGQGMQWEDYARVLPQLAKTYHVFAVDCFGHGESTHDPALYRCQAIGEALKVFTAQVVGERYLVSGHSSGGIIAAWLAAHDTERVSGCLLEDPPLFPVTPEEMQQEPGCFVWRDAFEVLHAYTQQTDVEDSAVYYAQNSYLFSLFGGLQPKIAQWTAEERVAQPDEHLTLAWVPHDWVRGMYFYDDFDVQFSEAFYTGSWFEGVDQADLLQRIACPTVYLKAETSYGKDGLLYAANSDEDAARVQGLLGDATFLTVKSGHNIHYEHADVFMNAVAQLG